MKRRHLVVLVSAITLATLVVLAAVFVGVSVGTDFGRDQIRGFVEQRVNHRVQGRVHLGKVSGNMLTGLAIDSRSATSRTACS
jgi:hypothetical protein